ncbi:hypothetical protein ONZ45_g533 [Pleurotus djamor]|nr:hypothetical protein ONZ45_g533 [Pleurotus djamor]
MRIYTSPYLELERDLELERRKVRDLHDASRERDKEYQKLKAQFDKIKRKALLSGDGKGVPMGVGLDGNAGGRIATAQNANLPFNVGAVVGEMQANGIQRTPLVARNGGGPFMPQNTMATNHGWNQPAVNQRRAFPANSHRTGSDRSESANEIENILLAGSNHREGVWQAADQSRGRLPMIQTTGNNRGLAT